MSGLAPSWISTSFGRARQALEASLTEAWRDAPPVTGDSRSIAQGRRRIALAISS